MIMPSSGHVGNDEPRPWKAHISPTRRRSAAWPIQLRAYFSALRRRLAAVSLVRT